VTPTQIVVNGKCIFMQYIPFYASGGRDFCGNNFSLAGCPGLKAFD
jgi:hypothetical protein